LVQAIGELTPETLQGRLRSVLSVDASERLAQVDVPVLCLRAARDVLVPSTAADWIQEEGRSMLQRFGMFGKVTAKIVGRGLPAIALAEAVEK